MNEILRKYKDYRRLYPAVRVSWTAYLHWKRGRRDLLFDYLLYREPPPTVQMRRGRAIHEALQELEEETFFRLLDVFVEDKITSVERESKYVVDLKGYEIPTRFSGVLDVLIHTEAGQIIVDWKTGPSSMRAFEEQIRLYGLLLREKGMHPIKGVLVKFNDKLEIKDIMEVYFYDDFDDIASRFDGFIQDLHYSILTGELDEYLAKIKESEHEQA